MTITFKIQDKDTLNQVGIAKSYKELYSQLLNHQSRGIAISTLKKKPTSFTIGQFRISKLDTKNATDNNQFKKPLGKTSEVVKVDNAKTVIEITKNKKVEFRNFLNNARKSGIHYFIQQRLVNVDKNSNAFAVVLKYRNNGIEKFAQTTYSSYNDLHKNLENLIQLIKDEYPDDELDFLGLSIEYFARPNLPQSYVFGGKENDKMKDELIQHLYESVKKNALLKFVKKYMIEPPSTTSLCVARACLMSDGETDYKKITSRVLKWSARKNITDEMNLQDKLNYISKAMKRTIIVYDKDLNLAMTVKPKITEGEISILIYASHSYALIPHKDKFNEVAFFQNFTRQKKMDYKKKEEKDEKEEKEEKEDKEKENMAKEDKKQKKKEKKNPIPVQYYYGSYDYETYTAEKGEKRTCDVKPYALGWTHNIINTNKENPKIIKESVLKACDEVKESVLKNGGNKKMVEEAIVKASEETIKNIKKNRYKQNYQYIYHDNDISIEFIKELSNIKVDKKYNNKLLMFAHNGGKFDAYELIYKLIGKTDIPIYNSLIKDGRIFQFSIKLNNGLTVVFRDSYILCAGSLDKLLKEFKCPTKKLTGEIDHKLINADNFMSLKEKVLPYLENDVLGLYELVDSMRKVYKEDYNINLETALTCASTARQFFINNHDWYNVPIYEIPFNQYLELKDYYYGGRCECFHIGSVEKELFYYDFTSLYPWVMAKSPYPYGTYKKKDISGEKFNPKWFGMVKAYVRTTDFTMRPYLPHKDSVGKLNFSHFKENTLLWITTEEWRYIIDNNLGYEITPLEILDYENQHTAYFKGMVDKLFKAKKDAEMEGNDARRAMSKIIVNSLYGFWGIKLSENEQLHIKQFTKPEKKNAFIQKHLSRNRLMNFEDVGEKTLVKTVEKLDAKCANIIIAQFTTAYARTELYNLMKDVDTNDGNMYYCDTDSIITDLNFAKKENEILANKYRLCVKGEALGDLTNEAGTVDGGYTQGVFLGCKSYLLVDKKYYYDLTMIELLQKNKKRIDFKNLTYSYKDIDKLKDSVIRKFKGINTKNIFKTKTINDDEEKTIIFTQEANFNHGDKVGLYNADGFYTLWIEDYVRMANGYKVYTDNWNFLSGTSSLAKESYLQYSANKKCSQCNDYSKGEVLENGTVIPLIV